MFVYSSFTILQHPVVADRYVSTVLLHCFGSKPTPTRLLYSVWLPSDGCSPCIRTVPYRSSVHIEAGGHFPPYLIGSPQCPSCPFLAYLKSNRLAHPSLTAPFLILSHHMASSTDSRLTQCATSPPLQTLTLHSINIQGLNTPEKRSKLLYSLQRSKTHIALIQETHFRSDTIPKLQNAYFPTVYHATNAEAKSKGNSILISKHCPLQVTEVHKDPRGGFCSSKALFTKDPSP